MQTQLVKAAVLKFGLPCAILGKSDSYRFSTWEIYCYVPGVTRKEFRKPKFGICKVSKTLVLTKFIKNYHLQKQWKNIYTVNKFCGSFWSPDFEGEVWILEK